MALPEIGSVASGFTLPNQDGKNVSLADYAGKKVLVWFFPRAFGRG
jgi:peroxiredoxin Q/BCP